ncbi:MAG: bifunctional precorrin-2 dehydrogenase/sirohydrochlorin ferrochelatase [Actinomycetota bacterium]
MAFGYPVFLELQGRLAVVIGEDAVRAGRVESLLEAGARVTVVAAGPGERLDSLEARGVAVHRREYEPGDLAGTFLCVAASADPDVRASVAAEARARGVLVNVMDDVHHCDFAAPAVVRRGDLVIAIGTGGRSPALARRLREELSERFGPGWTEAMRVIGDVRRDTLATLPDLGDRARRWEAALDLDEMLALVSEGRSEEARRRLTDRLLSGLEEPRTRGAVDGPASGVRVESSGAA